ncbi:MAG: heme-copper oxidase subunit III [Chloroflexi bacterium]|nr:heme-copper oxidase subunit III [Chloroflexota bacterium]
MTTAIAELKYQIYNRRLGLWLFMLSDSMVFLALLAARYYMQGTHRPPEVNQPLGLVLTSILLASSFFANRADASIAHGDRAAFLRHIGITIVLGVAFLILVVAVEWPEALHFAPPSTGYGTALFSLTGLHATHVLSGVIVLLFALLKGKRGGYTAEDHFGAEGSIIYWHFVDLVWVFIYPTLYLVG